MKGNRCFAVALHIMFLPENILPDSENSTGKKSNYLAEA
jgi:hypothetical protein